jgi:hypothetical protein
MKTMRKKVEDRNPVDLTILQNQGEILDQQHCEIARDTKGDLSQHGMDVCVPEDMPAPQGLTNIYCQDAEGCGIAYDSNDHSKIDDILKLVYLYDIPEKTRKKGTSAKGNNTQICGNPETEWVIVVKICLVQGQAPAHKIGDNPYH